MNKRFGARTQAAVMLAFLAGCGGGDSDGDVTGATGSGVATIGSSGGIVRGEGAVDAGGNATAVWSQRNAAGFTFNAWANRYSPITGWSTATMIDNSPEPARMTQIVIDGLGNVTAAWAQNSSARTPTSGPTRCARCESPTRRRYQGLNGINL